MPTKLLSHLRLLLAAATLALFTNCASKRLPADISPPEVWVTSIVPNGMTMMSTGFLIDLRIDNEHIEPLQVVGAVHKFYINGHYLGKGTSNQPLGVPGLSSVNQRVVANASNLKFLSGFNKVVNAAQQEYRLESTLHLRTAHGKQHRTTVENTGTVDLRSMQIPGLGGQAPRTAPRPVPQARSVRPANVQPLPPTTPSARAYR